MQAGQNKTPISGNLELLPLCNMKCDMCFVRLTPGEMEEKGGLRTADQWLELGKQMKEAGTLFLQLTGGEPLLFPEFQKVYSGLRQMGMILTINTNGTLIDEKMAEFLGHNKPRRVNVTLYGADEAAYEKLCHYPGGFEKTIRGIRLLKRQGIDVKLNGSLVKANKNDWKRLLEIAGELDAPIKIDTYMYPASRERDYAYDRQVRMEPEEAADIWLQILEEQAGTELYLQCARENAACAENGTTSCNTKSSQCRAGRSAFVINWQGNMRACIMLNEPEASAFELGFQAAWDQITEKMSQICLSDACTACRRQSMCPVCAASTYLESGSFEKPPQYLCDYTNHLLERQKEILKKCSYWTC